MQTNSKKNFEDKNIFSDLCCSVNYESVFCSELFNIFYCFKRRKFAKMKTLNCFENMITWSLSLEKK